MALGDDLIESFAIAPREHVALVGGGGKTTLMWALVEAGRSRGWRCRAGTTTRVGTWQVAEPASFLHDRREGDKLVGLTPERVDARWSGTDGERLDLLVVEADGSRSKVVKAPRPGEPVVPASVTLLVAVIGSDGLDRVIEDVAHRPLRVAAVCGCSPYERLTPERAARLLCSPVGGQRERPPGARFAVAVTRIRPRQAAAADRLAVLLREREVAVALLPWV